MQSEHHASNLLHRARELWPISIDIDDGLQALNECYREIDETYKDKLSLGYLALWAFHQSLWSIAKKCRSEGGTVVMTADVEISDFDSRMRENLADESWASERGSYLEANRTLEG